MVPCLGNYIQVKSKYLPLTYRQGVDIVKGHFEEMQNKEV